MPDTETTELLLDQCIQALLDGEDYRQAKTKAGDDVAPLVAIGHWLMQLARNVPPATPEGRARIWRRVTDSIDVGRLAAVVLPAFGSNHNFDEGAAAYR